jgi:hypothetical protein
MPPPAIPTPGQGVWFWCGSLWDGQPVAGRAGGGCLPPRSPLQDRGCGAGVDLPRMASRGEFTDSGRGFATPVLSQG